MSSEVLNNIKINMESKSTEELLNILKENDKEQYVKEAFDIIEEILKTRNISSNKAKNFQNEQVGNFGNIVWQKKAFDNNRKTARILIGSGDTIKIRNHYITKGSLQKVFFLRKRFDMIIIGLLLMSLGGPVVMFFVGGGLGGGISAILAVFGIYFILLGIFNKLQHIASRHISISYSNISGELKTLNLTLANKNDAKDTLYILNKVIKKEI